MFRHSQFVDYPKNNRCSGQIHRFCFLLTTPIVTLMQHMLKDLYISKIQLYYYNLQYMHEWWHFNHPLNWDAIHIECVNNLISFVHRAHHEYFAFSSFVWWNVFYLISFRFISIQCDRIFLFTLHCPDAFEITLLRWWITFCHASAIASQLLSYENCSSPYFYFPRLEHSSGAFIFCCGIYNRLQDMHFVKSISMLGLFAFCFVFIIFCTECMAVYGVCGLCFGPSI